MKRWLKTLLATAVSAAMLFTQTAAASGIPEWLNENTGPDAETFIYPEAPAPMLLSLPEQPPEDLRLPEVAAASTTEDGVLVAVSEHQKVYQLDDATYKTVISEIPNTYEDGAGNQRLIDNTLVSRNRLLDGEVYQNRANGYTVSLPAEMKRGQGVTFARDGVSVRMIPLDGDYTRSAVLDNAILYNGVYDGIDVQYTAHELGVKEDIILNRYVDKHTFEYELVVDGSLTLRLEEGALCVYRLGKAEPVMMIAAPIMGDESGALCELEMGLQNILGTNVLTITADAGWLAAPERAYPVHIDPNITVPTSKIQEVTTASARANGRYDVPQYGYAGSLTGAQIGSSSWPELGQTRMYYKINDTFTGIPQDAEIQSAIFSVYQYTDINGGKTKYECLRVESPWQTNTINATNCQGLAHAPAGGTNSSISHKGFHKFDIMDTVKGWIDGSLVNNGLAIKAVNENEVGGAFYTPVSSSSTPGQSRFTPDMAPQIIITWGSTEEPDPGEGSTDFIMDVKPIVNKNRKQGNRTVGVFPTGTGTPEHEIAAGIYEWIENPAYPGEGEISSETLNIEKEYVYPDITKYSSEYAGANIMPYATKENNWQTAASVKSTELSYDTIYIGRASDAQLENPDIQSDTFLLYQVQRSDLLPYIASYYYSISIDDSTALSTAIEALKKDNFLTDNLIIAGDVLFIRNPKVSKAYTPKPLSTYDKMMIDALRKGRDMQTEFGYEPINLNTGNFFFNTSDVSIPDMGGDFVLERSYNSIDPEHDGPFGRCWQFEYGETLSPLENGVMFYQRGDGSGIGFKPDGEEYIDLSGRGYVLSKMPFDTVMDDFGEGPEPYTIYEYELTDPQGTVRHFNSFGLLETITDSQGFTIEIYYDNYRISEIVSPAGVHFPVAMDENGHITSIGLPNGGTLLYAYDAEENLVRFTDAEGRETTYQYDGKHQMTSWTNPNGEAVVTNEYDAQGRVVKQTDAEGGVSTLAYADGKTTTTDAEGNVTVYHYDDSYRTTKIEYPDGSVAEYGYTGQNRTSATDGEGNTTVYEYDAQGRVTKETRFDGASRLYEYNGAGSPTKLTDFDGKVTRFEYDEKNNLTKQIFSDGTAVSYAYDALNRLVKITDANGNETAYAYGENTQKAWPVSVTDALGNITKFYYNAMGQIVTAEDALGGLTRYTYDKTGRKLTEQLPDDTLTKYVYDAAGSVTSITDARGLRTEFAYDRMGNMLSATDPAGRITAMAYDGLYRKTAETDPDRRATAYTYDPMGRLASVTDPDGNTTRYAYDKLGNRVTVTEPEGGASTAEYDLRFNLPQTLTNDQGAATSVEYDAVGNVVKAVTADGGEVSYTYDARNRVKTMTDAAGLVTEYGYDAAGNLVSTSDSLGRETAYAYDALNRPVSITNPNGGVTEIAYDALGRVASTTDPKGGETSYTYDAVGRMLSKTDPLGQTVEYAYDENSNLIRQIAENGGVTESQYDELDRLTIVTDPLGHQTALAYDGSVNVLSTQNALGYQWQYAYNGRALPVSMTDSMGNVYALEYDKNGNNTKVTTPNGASTVMEYDSLNRLVKKTDGAGLVTEYAYDAMDRVIRIHDNARNNDRYAYDAAGRVTAMTNALGQETKYAYDAAGRVTSVTTYDGNTTEYGYDLMGNVTSITDPEGKTTTYTYDANNNLVGSEDALRREWRYHYDALNRLTESVNPLDEATGYAYDELSNLVRVTDPAGNADLTEYDLVGNPVKRTDRNGNSYAYTYDELYRLIQAANPDGGKQNFLYDPLDRLVKAQDPMGHVTQYEYDTVSNLVKQTLPNNGVYEFTYDLHGVQTSVKDPLGGLTRYTVDLNGQTTKKVLPNGAEYGYAYDAIHRITGLTAPEGMSKEFAYDEKGNLASDTDQAGRVNTYAYDIMHRMLSTTNAEGHTLTMGYDVAGNLANVVTPLGYETSYEYDPLDRIQKTLDPVGRTLEYQYDVTGNITKVTKNGGRVTTYGYDAVGNMLSTVNPLEQTTKYAYDSMNRLVKETDVAGASQSYAYDLDGLLLKATAKNGGVTSFGYDAMHNVVSASDAEGRSATYQYDLLNRMTSMVDGDNIVTTYRYDAVGNMTARTNGEGHTTEYAYDLADRVTSITNPLGEVQKMQYNLQGNLSEFTNPDGSTISYDYDKLDALVSKSTSDDSATNAALYGYDADGRRVTMEDFLGEASYEYDGVGRITAVNLPVSMTTGDSVCVGVTTGDSVNVQVTGGARITYEYDEWGNLAALGYPDGTSVQYEYDALDRMTAIIDRAGKRTVYTYDLSGNMVKVTRPNGTRTEIEYDVMGNVTKLTNYGVNQIYHTEEIISEYTYAYDLTGFITKEVQKIGYTGTITRTFAYDNRGQLVRVVETDIAGYTVQRNYTYDKNGNLIRETQTKPYDYYDKAECETIYQYNEADRLTAKKVISREQDWWGQFSETCMTSMYEYDANGNRVLEVDPYGEEREYKYDVENRLLAVREAGTLLFAALYDGNGDRVFQMLPHKLNEYAPGVVSPVYPDGGNGSSCPDTGSDTGSCPPPEEDYWQQWEDSMACSSEDAPSGTTETTTGDGVKIELEPPQTTTGDSAKAGQTGCGVDIPTDILEDVMFVPNGIDHTNIDQYDVVGYINDINVANTRVLMEYNKLGALGNIYEYGTQLNSVDHRNDKNFYLYDGRGSVSGLTAGQKALQVIGYTYNEWGVVTGGNTQSGGYFSTPFQYNAEAYDISVSLQYLRARYYDPNTRGFISQDTVWGKINVPLSQNLYAYVQNNPLNFVDPSGHEAEGRDYVGPPTYQQIQDELYESRAVMERQQKIATGRSDSTTATYVDLTKFETSTSKYIDAAKGLSVRVDCWYIDQTTYISYYKEVLASLDKLLSSMNSRTPSALQLNANEKQVYLEAIHELIGSLKSPVFADGVRAKIVVSPGQAPTNVLNEAVGFIPYFGSIYNLVQLSKDERSTALDWTLGVTATIAEYIPVVGQIANKVVQVGAKTIKFVDIINDVSKYAGNVFSVVGGLQSLNALLSPDYAVKVDIYIQTHNTGPDAVYHHADYVFPNDAYKRKNDISDFAFNSSLSNSPGFHGSVD